MGKSAAKQPAKRHALTRPRRRSSTRRTAAPPAKISVPLLPETYRRERIFQVLDAALRKHVVWVAAPAGAGKTSVVTTYLKARKLSSLWYNVDARDSDIANLFYYLALAARLGTRGKKPPPVFTTEHQAGVSAFARGFFEALGSELPSPSVIVIDDYQEARSELLDEVLREAICALPRGISTIIISRDEAPRWLARHLASGDVAAVGWDVLRLTPTEVTGLARLYRPDLKGPHLREILPQLIEVANGWAAALMLLLQNRNPAPVDARGMEEFSQRLFDYFATEILAKLTATQREFLLRTSVVPTLTASLAARLTEKTSVNDVLGDIERRSFLVQRLGTSGAFRYHPLLRGFFLRQAEIAFGRPVVRDLHRAAARALIETGQFDESMQQLESAEDFDAYIDLLLRVAPSYIGEGRGRSIEAWIGKLPRQRVEESGWLLQWEGVSCLPFAATRSREVLERAYTHFVRHQDAAGLYSCCAAGMQAVIYEGIDHGRCGAWVERLEALLAKGPPCPEPLLPMVSTAMLLNSLFRQPEPPDNPVWAERATALARTSPDVTHRVVTGGLLAMRSVLHESIDSAEVTLEMLRASARASQSSDLSVLTLLHARALTAWAAGGNATCLDLVREGLSVGARTGVFVWNDYFTALGMCAALGSEDIEAARPFLDMARTGAEQGRTMAVATYYLYASLDAFLRGERAHALHMVELSLKSGETFNRALTATCGQFAYAQILWRSGEQDEARRALARARQHACEQGYALAEQACDLVESELEWAVNRERALAALRRGLKLARERGYHNMFWLRKSTLNNVAVRALAHGIETEHVRVSIARHGLVPPSLPLQADSWPYPYRFRVLGGFELTRGPAIRTASNGSGDRQGSPLRGMPQRLLEAILALGGRGVRDTDLIDALWPDAEGDAGRRVFDTTLHRLRRQLGNDEIVRLTDGRVSLDEHLCWVDIWALEVGLAEANRALAQRAPIVDLVNQGRQLLGLYRGPLLADDAAGWAFEVRQRIAGKFRLTVERLAASLEARGETSDAKSLYQSAFRAHR